MRCKLNQKGVTLIELLVIIILIAAISAPIFALVSYSLKTEREVATRNDIQREARLVMEYITEKMRDRGNYWFDDGTNWILCSYDLVTNRCSNTLLTYESTSNQMRFEEGSRVLANDVTLTLTPAPISMSLSTGEREVLVNSLEVQEVTFEIQRSSQVIELKSTIYFDRF
ncbi:prepilin-type N-terminal cleavage/methylation domain-containing protein [Halalkalibacter urbisdiaboli]|uniref:prepilin-type N-terminal cleavage/methylation domain-containing protein n=1 Tax=Halalkalibacter urbisdiaboli TaxID=1960589 RepID=UPI000B44AEFD|nr:prepilin-type N-terminal cleavage/methylation domain-containing protein [Halalkalibacter urbisdiaboli]